MWGNSALCCTGLWREVHDLPGQAYLGLGNGISLTMSKITGWNKKKLETILKFLKLEIIEKNNSRFEKGVK